VRPDLEDDDDFESEPDRPLPRSDEDEDDDFESEPDRPLPRSDEDEDEPDLSPDPDDDVDPERFSLEPEDEDGDAERPDEAPRLESEPVAADVLDVALGGSVLRGSDT